MFFQTMPPDFNLEVEDLRQYQDEQTDFLLLDIRESWELAKSRLDPHEHIPMRDLTARFQSLPKDRPVIVMCHHGIRSRHAALWLRQQGLENAFNLRGGIDAYAKRIDSDVGTY